MSRTLIAMFAAAGLCFAGATTAQTTTPQDKNARDQAIKAADAAYKADKEACDAMSGNAKDICMQEAKGKEKVAKAEAKAAYDATPKARENARLARAEATYEVAKEKCDDMSGNQKDVCVTQAKAAYTKAKADAKVDRVAADTSGSAVRKTAEAKKDAAEDKRDADYKVAVEKCDSLSGNAKDACVRDAKAKHGKT
jgi:hypothetical protein